jgi:hypothetical protein
MIPEAGRPDTDEPIHAGVPGESSLHSPVGEHTR